MSGIMVGSFIKEIEKGKVDVSSCIKVYDRWIKEWFINDKNKLVYLYSKLTKPPSWINSSADPLII